MKSKIALHENKALISILFVSAIEQTKQNEIKKTKQTLFFCFVDLTKTRKLHEY